MTLICPQVPLLQYCKESLLVSHLNQCLAIFLKCSNSTDMSTLPPLITQHTFFPLNRPSFSTAATTVAEEGSITIFILSRTSCVAYIISSSVTRMMSSLDRCSLRMSKVSGPRLVLSPSAIEIGGSCPTISPFSNESLASRAR
jgi:hypothetical protein